MARILQSTGILEMPVTLILKLLKRLSALQSDQDQDVSSFATLAPSNRVSWHYCTRKAGRTPLGRLFHSWHLWLVTWRGTDCILPAEEEEIPETSISCTQMTDPFPVQGSWGLNLGGDLVKQARPVLRSPAPQDWTRTVCGQGVGPGDWWVSGPHTTRSPPASDLFSPWQTVLKSPLPNCVLEALKSLIDLHICFLLLFNKI